MVVKNLRNVPQLFPQESRRLSVTCPAPEEEEILTCGQEAEKLKDQFEESIDDLTSLFNDLDCDSELSDPCNSDECKSCTSIQDAICDLKRSKDEAVAETFDGCRKAEEAEREREEAETTMAAAIAEFNSRRALADVDATDPDLAIDCLALVTTSLEVKKTITTTITELGIAADALSGTKDFLDTIKVTSEATIIGIPAGAALGVAINLIIVVNTALNIAIRALEAFLAQSELEDDDNTEICNDIKEEYRRALAKDTNDHVETIENITEENQKYLEFLSCRFGENPPVFVGAGCDGLDNDCDSDILNGIIRVDECDEDQVPPTLELSKDPPATFFSQEEGVAWFMENTAVSDDCVPQARLLKTLVESNVQGQVTIRVDDTRCSETIVPVRQRALVDGRSLQVDGPGEPTTTRTFFFVVDGEAPTVTCGFGAGGNPLVIDRFEVNRDLVDVQFWFNIAVRFRYCP